MLETGSPEHRGVEIKFRVVGGQTVSFGRHGSCVSKVVKKTRIGNRSRIQGATYSPATMTSAGGSPAAVDRRVSLVIVAPNL